MTSIGVIQIVLFFGLILVCTKPLGAYMAKVFEGQRTFHASSASVAGSAHL